VTVRNCDGNCDGNFRHNFKQMVGLDDFFEDCDGNCVGSVTNCVASQFDFVTEFRHKYFSTRINLHGISAKCNSPVQ